MAMDYDAQVATTILNQLGGLRRLEAMIGAYHVFRDGADLQFRFRGSKKANYIKVHLNERDLYDITFGKIRAMKFEVVGEYNDVYEDTMKGIFEKFTGLYLSL